MFTSTSQVCSALVHKYDMKICSLNASSETELPTHSHTSGNNEIKTDERNGEHEYNNNNKLIVSSDISISHQEQIETGMGNKALKTKNTIANFTELTDHQIDVLVSTTKFSPQQVREWHQSFIRDCPSGKLDRKQFIEVYRQFYPQGKADAFCTLAFKAFDRDKNGIVDFNEFLSAIALTMSGEVKNRLDLAFSMYDINGDDFLDKKEITQIIKLIYEVNGKRNLSQELTPQDKARLIIDKFDMNGDRKLSREEFITGCLNDSEIRKLLAP